MNVIVGKDDKSSIGTHQQEASNAQDVPPDSSAMDSDIIVNVNDIKPVLTWSLETSS